MKIKFKTFHPERETCTHGTLITSAAGVLNKWLKENPKVEIISWQTTAVGTTNELYITIQYKEDL